MQPFSAFVVALVGVLISLMELAMRPGEPGYNLHMQTEAVYERLKGRYQFEGPTAVLVKGKGELLTYRLAGRRIVFAPEESSR